MLEKTGTVLVKWFQLTELPNGDEAITDLGVKEESVYDLRPHPEYTFYRLHTNLFLKKNRPDAPSQAGVVLNIDVQNGTMRLGAASTSETFTVYPHEVVPLNQRCYWNFFTRKWEVDVLLPHEHQLVIERKVPGRSTWRVVNSQFANCHSVLQLLFMCLHFLYFFRRSSSSGADFPAEVEQRRFPPQIPILPAGRASAPDFGVCPFISLFLYGLAEESDFKFW